MKSSQRKSALRARRRMTSDDRERASEKICAAVVRCHEFLAARTIACYLPMDDEVDPGRIIERAWRAKKRVFCPVVGNRSDMTFRRLDRDTTLQRSSYGLWEPVGGHDISPRQLDLVITPLVAFDADNNRIGMGGGYYDRCFAFQKGRKHWRRPKLIGIAFNCQRIEKIAANPWDIRLYGVVTENTLTEN